MMKRILATAALAMAISSFSGCSSNHKEQPANPDTIQFNGTTYTLVRKERLNSDGTRDVPLYTRPGSSNYYTLALDGTPTISIMK